MKFLFIRFRTSRLAVDYLVTTYWYEKIRSIHDSVKWQTCWFKTMHSLIFQTHRQIRDFTAFKKIWILTKMFFLFHFDKKWIITSYLKKIGNPFKLGREMKRQWSKYEKYKTRLASEARIAISIFGCLLFTFRFKWTYLAKTSSQTPHIHSVSFPNFISQS